MQPNYNGVPLDQLRLVRVVQGLDNIKVDGDTAHFERFAPNEHTIRNTLHFTLNGIVSNHSSNVFSESKYAIIGNFAETVENNKIHGLAPSDTFFWGSDFKIKSPTIVMPENDPNIEKFGSNFNVIQYKPDDDVTQNFKNLSSSVQQHFKEEQVPFKPINMWGWADENMITEDAQAKFSRELGLNHTLPQSHESSIDKSLEDINASVVVSKQMYYELKTKEQFSHESTELHETVDKSEKFYASCLKKLKEQNPHAVDYYSKLGERVKELREVKNERCDYFFPEENPINESATLGAIEPNPTPQPIFTGATPPPIPPDIYTGEIPPPPQSLHIGSMSPPPIPQDIYIGEIPPPPPQSLHIGSMPPPPIPQDIYIGEIPPPPHQSLHIGSMPPPLPPEYTSSTPPPNPQSDALGKIPPAFPDNSFFSNYRLGIAQSGVTTSLLRDKDEIKEMEGDVALLSRTLTNELLKEGLNPHLTPNEIEEKIQSKEFSHLQNKPEFLMHVENLSEAQSEYTDRLTEHLSRMEDGYKKSGSLGVNDLSELNAIKQTHTIGAKNMGIDKEALTDSFSKIEKSISQKTSLEQPKNQQTKSLEM